MKLEDLHNELLAELSAMLDYQVTLDEDLLVEGGLDSFGIMQVVAYLEDAYAMRVPDEILATANFASARVIGDWLLTLLPQG